MSDYDNVILDAGGDDLIILSGPMANRAEVTRVMAKLRAERRKRLDESSPEHRDMFERWANRREHVYGRRVVAIPGEGDLTIYLSAPSLADALAHEAELGSDRFDLADFDSQCRAGMIHGRFSSRIDSEIGSTHVCDLVEISRDEYEQAKREGWPDV